MFETNYPLYVEVILPLAAPGTFTYAVPEDLAGEVVVGKRVCVQFGAKRFYAALVCKTTESKPSFDNVKEIVSVIDALPIIGEAHLRFWEWISFYYICTIGEVMKAALPASLKMESETVFVPVNVNVDSDENLSDEEAFVLKLLTSKGCLQIEELVKLAGKKSLRTLRLLEEKQLVAAQEKITESWTPRIERYVRLSDDYKTEEKLTELLESLTRAPKRLELLENYLRITNYTGDDEIQSISRSELMKVADASPSALKGLIDKKIFEIFDAEISRLGDYEGNLRQPAELNDAQQKAKDEIVQLFDQKQVVLLHGVTSSGKTEIYIHLMKKALDEGRQVLYLLPEIALTSQIIRRLQGVFGNMVGIYHSKFNDAERAEVWRRVSQENGYQVILGVRSSVFLPFRNLGLIIIDEEHENTFKQYDPAPRYHARDASIVLANLFNAKVLLGTATPSVESYFNTKTGKYGLVELFQRFSDIALPAIKVADIRRGRLKRTMHAMFSQELVKEIDTTLKNDKQIILFQNRRGFAPYLECQACGWVPRCKNCDVSLTLHKAQQQMVCHYCGYAIPIAHKCAECASPQLETKGFGTEKIEDDIAVLFPGAKVARLDLDTTRSRKSYDDIISQFENNQLDILVGTQMVTKGLDFNNVSLVGVVDADSMLNFPDFRAHERAYQLMLQVAGRAGRKGEQGRVVIQTRQIDHHIIDQVIRNDYANLFNEQIADRQMFKYPPYFRLIRFTLRHKQKENVIKAAGLLAARMRDILGPRVLGPDLPPIDRIQSLYIRNIVVKIEREASIEHSRNVINSILADCKNLTEFNSVSIAIDVDPY
jgi:primosomal protein N' (replication factor Y)